ncbi:hypothetical protein [Vibrio ulleungensis]|uniref:Uncharacterized protein n=1 Tax=Vibrio ulleungensis TaxID=2807619 RepID=A0ABS2HF99_9VIBR|nr:hypothetical protein [Vibrio ulleungensis]MBM7035017.1 hypothetical protein [Vibrio ulleungensis]
MPIAHCVLSPYVANPSNDSTLLIEKWGRHSGLDSSEMTITIVQAIDQAGKSYDATCTLTLPNLWSPKSVSLLQLGLASALSEHFGIEPDKVIVMTSLIESGRVVDGGNEINW